jgi:NADH-quinone oxidoreductase subunit I
MSAPATGPVVTASPQAAPPAHPTATKPYRYTFADRLYLPLLQGMMVTARHFFKNLWKSKYTISYPEERRPYSGRYRGHHILCATACPAECIHIEAGEQPDVNIEKYPVVYEIDMLRCVFCGYCVDACPEEAIIMSRNTDMAYFTREQSIVGKAELMKPFTVDQERLGYRPYYPEEDRKRAQMRREAFDLVSAARGEG